MDVQATASVVTRVKVESLDAVLVSARDVMVLQSHASVWTNQSAGAPPTVASTQNVVSFLALLLVFCGSLSSGLEVFLLWPLPWFAHLSLTIATRPHSNDVCCSPVRAERIVAVYIGNWFSTVATGNRCR